MKIILNYWRQCLVDGLLAGFAEGSSTFIFGSMSMSSAIANTLELAQDVMHCFLLFGSALDSSRTASLRCNILLAH